MNVNNQHCKECNGTGQVYDITFEGPWNCHACGDPDADSFPEHVEVLAWRIGFKGFVEHGYKVYEQYQPWAYQNYGSVQYEVQELMSVSQFRHILSSFETLHAKKMANANALLRRAKDVLSVQYQTANGGIINTEQVDRDAVRKDIELWLGE